MNQLVQPRLVQSPDVRVEQALRHLEPAHAQSDLPEKNQSKVKHQSFGCGVMETTYARTFFSFANEHEFEVRFLTLPFRMRLQ